MALAQRREIDAILVTELSRWGRGTLDLLHTLQELEARRVSVIAMSGLAFDLSTAHGWMMATGLAGIAAFERELAQERIRSGIAAAKARGKKLGRQPGQRPKSDRLAQGADPHRPGSQLPLGRARIRAEQEYRRRDRQTPPRHAHSDDLIATLHLVTRMLTLVANSAFAHCSRKVPPQAGWIGEASKTHSLSDQSGGEFATSVNVGSGTYWRREREPSR